MARVPEALRFDRLAELLGLEERLAGAAAAGFTVLGVAALEDAGAGDLGFARSAAHAGAAHASRAGGLIVPLDFEDLPGAQRPLLRVPRPELVFARALHLLFRTEVTSEGVSPEALVDATAEIDASARVAAGVFVGARSRIGAKTVVHANATIYADVEIGSDCEIHSGAVIREGTRVGNRVCLQPRVVLGADGFGLVMDEGGSPLRMPQVGCVVVEDDVEIGAGTTVDRAALGVTRIRRGAKIDNLVMIGHNCDVGEETIIVAQSGLSGSTEVGRRAILMAQSGTAGHLRVGAGALLGARAGVHKDVPDGAHVWGWPAAPARDWHRRMSALARLPNVLRRLRRLERRVASAPPQAGKSAVVDRDAERDDEE